MRSILLVGMLLALIGPASAATAHRTHRSHAYVVTGADRGRDPMSGFAYVPRTPALPMAVPNDQPDPTVDSPYKNWGG